VVSATVPTAVNVDFLVKETFLNILRFLMMVYKIQNYGVSGL
jgi:hypothetical protein